MKCEHCEAIIRDMKAEATQLPSSPISGPAKSILSRREAEVAAHTIQGAPCKNTAAALFITDKTVKYHLTQVYRKLNVKGRMGLTILWHKGGIDPATYKLIKRHMT